VTEWPATDRADLWFAELNAKAGRADSARAWLARYDAAITDTALRRWDMPDLQHAQFHLAMTEQRWMQAAELIRQSDRRPDGPANSCSSCMPIELTELFAEANMPDSALAVYAAYRRSPVGARPRQGLDSEVGAPLTAALARMFDAKGDTANAVLHYREFIELWSGADPELQPRVVDARNRLRQLTPVER
jgi:hypothetical protein